MTADAIREMAYSFMRKQALDKVDTNHDNALTPGVQIVESFIARKDDPDFIEGSWVIGCHVDDDTKWEAVKKGELNGFSIEAMVLGEEVEVEIEIPPVVSGRCSKSEVDGHEHQFFVSYDENGKFLGGRTDSVDGHFHRILAGTHTETADGHNHRFSAVDDLQVVDA